MNRNLHDPVIHGPEEELQNVYKARIAPFVELRDSEKVNQYEKAWEIARSYLKKARERKDTHVA